MSESQDIKPRVEDDLVAPTPQNTPLNTHVPTSRPAQKPKVEDVAEGDEDEGEDVSSMNPASLLASNPALLALAQHKLGALVGRPSGYIQSLPPAVRRRIDGLKGLQVEHSKIESEFQLAILEVEKKVCTLPCCSNISSLPSTSPSTTGVSRSSRARLSPPTRRLPRARTPTRTTRTTRRRVPRSPSSRTRATRSSRVSPSSGSPP
jgi:hypothetical protein